MEELNETSSGWFWPCLMTGTTLCWSPFPAGPYNALLPDCAMPPPWLLDIYSASRLCLWFLAPHMPIGEQEGCVSVPGTCATDIRQTLKILVQLLTELVQRLMSHQSF